MESYTRRRYQVNFGTNRRNVKYEKITSRTSENLNEQKTKCKKQTIMKLQANIYICIINGKHKCPSCQIQADI